MYCELSKCHNTLNYITRNLVISRCFLWDVAKFYAGWSFWLDWRRTFAWPAEIISITSSKYLRTCHFIKFHKVHKLRFHLLTNREICYRLIKFWEHNAVTLTVIGNFISGSLFHGIASVFAHGLQARCECRSSCKGWNEVQCCSARRCHWGTITRIVCSKKFALKHVLNGLPLADLWIWPQENQSITGFEWLKRLIWFYLLYSHKSPISTAAGKKVSQKCRF